MYLYMWRNITHSCTSPHTHTKIPLRSVSCRSRPECPFRCNLICTPIILCFSGGCVSRAPSQHVDLLLPSISECSSLAFTSSPISVSLEKPHHTYTHTPTHAPPTHTHTHKVFLSLHCPHPYEEDVPSFKAYGSSFTLPFWNRGCRAFSSAGVIDDDLS